MYEQEERYCPHCKKFFYVRGFKLRDAKTLKCLYCTKRFKVTIPQKNNVRTINVLIKDNNFWRGYI